MCVNVPVPGVPTGKRTGLPSADKLLGRNAPTPIKLPDYAPHREQLCVPGHIFGPMSKPGQDPRVRLPTPPYRPMTNGFGVPIIVPAVPLPVDAHVDGMVLGRASPLPLPS